MSTTEQQKSNPSNPKSRPAFRAWLVQDDEQGEARWTELSGLWPTKSGKGFKGGLRTPVSATTGRIVILPASFQPAQGGNDHAAAN